MQILSPEESMEALEEMLDFYCMGDVKVVKQ